MNEHKDGNKVFYYKFEKPAYLLRSLHFDSFFPTVNPLVSIHRFRSSTVLSSITFSGNIAPATSLSLSLTKKSAIFENSDSNDSNDVSSSNFTPVSSQESKHEIGSEQN